MQGSGSNLGEKKMKYQLFWLNEIFVFFVTFNSIFFQGHLTYTVTYLKKIFLHCPVNFFFFFFTLFCYPLYHFMSTSYKKQSFHMYFLK